MTTDDEPSAAGNPDSNPFRRYRLMTIAFGIAFLFLVTVEFASNFGQPIDRDFISFWAAAVLTLQGAPASAYDVAAHNALQLQSAAFEGLMPFPYPPAFLLLLLPFGLLPYPAAIVAWTFTTFAAYFAAAKRLFPEAGWFPAAFPPVLVNAVIGQNAFVTAGLFISGLVLLPKRPFMAGLVLGCLIIKPQLGLLLPLAFIAGRQWRAFAGAAIAAAGLLLAGLIAFGLEATGGWISQMPLYASIARDGLIGWHKLASVYASLRQAGLGPTPALIAHFAVALAAGLMVWRIWRSPAEPAAKGAVLAAATMLASPYLFLYDAVILIAPFCWLVARRARPTLLAVLWCVPFITIAQAYGYNGPVNLNPIVPIALMILIHRETRRPRPALDEPSETITFGSARRHPARFAPSRDGWSR